MKAHEESMTEIGCLSRKGCCPAMEMGGEGMGTLSPLPVLGSVTCPPLTHPNCAALCLCLTTQHQSLFLQEALPPHSELHPDSPSLIVLYTDGLTDGSNLIISYMLICPRMWVCAFGEGRILCFSESNHGVLIVNNWQFRGRLT